MGQHSSDAGGMRTDMMRSSPVWRVAQFYRALRLRPDPEIDRRLRATLQNDEQWRLLARLSAFDRAHHLGVRDLLVDAGHNDPDLLLAAALHDIGKADDRGRVRLVHRIVNVTLKRLSPPTLERLSNRDGGWLAHGMFLARHHARLGAELAAFAGASSRCCELIAGHEGAGPFSDPDLAALVEADARAIACQ